MASASSTYQPRRPEQGALHQLVRDHFETFRAQAAQLRRQYDKWRRTQPK